MMVMATAGVQAADHILRRVGAGEHDEAARGEAVQGRQPRGAQRPLRDRGQPGACKCIISIKLHCASVHNAAMG
jgi:hypothetical protein